MNTPGMAVIPAARALGQQDPSLPRRKAGIPWLDGSGHDGQLPGQCANASVGCPWLPDQGTSPGRSASSSAVLQRGQPTRADVLPTSLNPSIAQTAARKQLASERWCQVPWTLGSEQVPFLPERGAGLGSCPRPDPALCCLSGRGARGARELWATG